MAFVAFLYREQLSGSTVKNYLAAIRHSQITLGMGDPHMGDMHRLDYVVKGLKRQTRSGPTLSAANNARDSRASAEGLADLAYPEGRRNALGSSHNVFFRFFENG